MFVVQYVHCKHYFGSTVAVPDILDLCVNGVIPVEGLPALSLKSPLSSPFPFCFLLQKRSILPRKKYTIELTPLFKTNNTLAQTGTNPKLSFVIADGKVNTTKAIVTTMQI